MKNRILFYLLTLLALTSACKKKDTQKDEVPPASVPTVATSSASLIASKTAFCGGDITADGGVAISDRGLCWSTNPNPTTADNNCKLGPSIGRFVATIVDLIPGTTYYVRAFATNSAGTGYGDNISFKTVLVTDADGNTYHAVTIGTQVWMVENLKTSKFNDGSSIPIVNSQSTWSNLATPGCCWYYSDPVGYNAYGMLYNWYAVNSGNLAPKGWHVPTDAEWTTLTNNLGGESVAGGKLKEVGVYHWLNNKLATNESGFTGLGGGWRDYTGKFDYEGSYGYWWTSSEQDLFFVWTRQMEAWDGRVNAMSYDKSIGMSVRCVKD